MYNMSSYKLTLLFVNIVQCMVHVLHLVLIYSQHGNYSQMSLLFLYNCGYNHSLDIRHRHFLCPQDRGGLFMINPWLRWYNYYIQTLPGSYCSNLDFPICLYCGRAKLLNSRIFIKSAIDQINLKLWCDDYLGQ